MKCRGQKKPTVWQLRNPTEWIQFRKI